MRKPSRVLTLALVLAAVALGVHLGGQGVAVPPAAPLPGGSPTGPPATGTGLIVGRVIDGSTSKPIQGVSVTASSTSQPLPSAPASAATGFRPQSIVTGSDGVFVFRNLPKGTFALRGGLLGYLSASTSSGPAVLTSSQSVSLEDGEKINDLELRLWRSGAVMGQVLDEQGEAVEGITITVLRIATTGGRRTISMQQSATTDDRGMYRISGLTPGDYSVCALFSRHIAPVAAGVAQFSGNGDMQRTLSGSGALSPSGSGYRVGDLMLISSSSSRNVDPAPSEDGRLSVFADACYPSAPTVQGAEAVHIDSGQDRSELNMVLRIVPSVRILGTLSGPSNRLSGMAVHLYPAAPGDVTIVGAIEAAQTVTDPEGGFGFIGVPAGSYVLKVTYAPRSEQAIPQELIDRLIAEGAFVPDSFFERPPVTAPAEPTLWAIAPVTVGETDVTGLALALREGPRVTGRIAFEGTKARPAADRLASATISFDAVDGSASNTYAQARGRVVPDGTFSTMGVVPGRYLVRLQGAWPGWTLKSIVAGGREVSDDPLDITGADIDGVVITMTDRPSELSGSVRTDSGAPDRRANVLVFPSDRARWTQTNAGRRMASTGVSKQGTFTVSGLPAGDYFVVATNESISSNWQDPRMLDTLSRIAARVTIRDAEPRKVDLVTSVIR